MLIALVIGRAVHSPAYVAELLAEAAGSGNASLADVKSYVSENLKLQNYTDVEVSFCHQEIPPNPFDDCVRLTALMYEYIGQVGCRCWE